MRTRGKRSQISTHKSTLKGVFDVFGGVACEVKGGHKGANLWEAGQGDDERGGPGFTGFQLLP